MSSVHAIRERTIRLKRLCDELDREQGRDTSPYQMLIDRILAEADTFPVVERARRLAEPSHGSRRLERKKV